MSYFRIVGRCIADPPPADWREQLVARLGVKPRRIGTWAELGLYGALACLEDAGETMLTAQADLMLSSQHGPVAALRNAVEQSREDLPMPLTFLQTQPSQLLATLAAHMHWRGDASFIAHADPQGLLCLAAAQQNRDGLLLGWVEETGQGRSVWLRLQPCEQPAADAAVSDFSWEHLAQAGYLHVASGKVVILPAQA